MYRPVQNQRGDPVGTAPSTSKGRATAERILDAACVLFARQGIRATTLDDVGALSRTGRGQLYLYFGGRADLVVAVVRRQVERILDAQRPVLEGIGTAEDVRAWCALAARQYADDDPLRCPIGSLVHELTEDDAAARAVLAEGFRRWRAALAEGLRRVQRAGGLAAGSDPDAVAGALLAAYQGGVLVAAATGDRAVLGQVLDAAASGVLAGGTR
jgi:TetR/AcrR family transcriptional regulator, transcriptional repressor for nem operon